MKEIEERLMREIAEREYYPTIFDVWIHSGRELIYSTDLWEYFSVVAAPVMKDLLPDRTEFRDIVHREQKRRAKIIAAKQLLM